MFSIDRIKANLALVRPNLFLVRLTLPPTIFNSNDTARIRTLEFRCESTEIPGRTIATYDDQSTGTTKKLAYDVTYNDITMTIIASEDMTERYIFEKWIDNVVYPSSHNEGNAKGGLVNYYDRYAKGIVELYQLRGDGTYLFRYILHDAYPLQVSPMTLNWGENDTYQRFTVTMTYRYHTFDLE